MASGVAHHSEHSNLLDARFEVIRDGLLEDQMDPLDQFFTKGTPEQQTVRVGNMTPIGLWSQHAGTLTFTSPDQGYTVTAEPLIYSQGMGLDRQLRDYELFNITDRWMRYLVRSGMDTQSDLKASVLRDMFSTSPSTYTNTESVAFFSNSHTTPRSGVSTSVGFDNLVADYLSPTSLKDGLILGRKIRDLAGQHMNSGGLRKLVVPVDLQFQAEEIVKTTMGIWGEPSDNTVNVLKDRFEIIVLERLTNADRWYLFSEDFKEYSHHLEKVPVEFNSVEKFESFVAMYRGYFDNHFYIEPDAWHYAVGGNPS